MTDKDPIDKINEVDIDSQLKANRKKYLISIGVLIIFNTIMFGILIKGRDFTDNL